MGPCCRPGPWLSTGSEDVPVLPPPEGGLAGDFAPGAGCTPSTPQCWEGEASDVHQKSGPALMGSLQGSFQPCPEGTEDWRWWESLPAGGDSCTGHWALIAKGLEGQAMEVAPEKLKHAQIMEQSTEQLRAQQDPDRSRWTQEHAFLASWGTRWSKSASGSARGPRGKSFQVAHKF